MLICREPPTLDDVVVDVLAAAGVVGPQVDALDLARRLGICVALDAQQRPRGRLVRAGGRTTIFVRPDRRLERLQWVVAQELGRFLLPRVEERGEVDWAQVRPIPCEELVHQIGSRLLLPSLWFGEQAGEVGGDLWRLKGVFKTASLELIAWRLLDLPERSVVSWFDQGRLICRRGNGPHTPSRLGAVENWCWRQVQEFSEPCEIRQAGYRIQGWPIHEPGWHREVVRMVWEEERVEERTLLAGALSTATAGILAKKVNAD